MNYYITNVLTADASGSLLIDINQNELAVGKEIFKNMPKLVWDKIGERYYETGVDHGVYYSFENGAYSKGVAWSGLTSVSESPSGADASDQYADNIKYVSLRAAETFGGTIEAFTYPKEFEEADGYRDLTEGVKIGQQSRKSFGFSYRTKLGSDADPDYGYVIHLVYGVQVSPSSKSRSTTNESPELLTMSWEFTTTPIEVAGFKPTATLEINSTKIPADKLKALEDELYGSTDGKKEPHLPLPSEILTLVGKTTA